MEDSRPDAASGIESAILPVCPLEEIAADGQRFIRSDGFILREIAGEALLIPTGENPLFQNSMITPNEVWCFLWKTLAVPRTVPEVVSIAHEEYEAPEGEIERSVTGFIEQTYACGMIRKEGE